MVQPVVQHLLFLVVPLLLVTAALLAWQPARFRGAGSAGSCQHCNATRVAFSQQASLAVPSAPKAPLSPNAIAVPAQSSGASHVRAPRSYRMHNPHAMTALAW